MPRAPGKEAAHPQDAVAIAHVGAQARRRSAMAVRNSQRGPPCSRSRRADALDAQLVFAGSSKTWIQTGPRCRRCARRRGRAWAARTTQRAPGRRLRSVSRSSPAPIASFAWPRPSGLRARRSWTGFGAGRHRALLACGAWRSSRTRVVVAGDERGVLDGLGDAPQIARARSSRGRGAGGRLRAAPYRVRNPRLFGSPAGELGPNLDRMPTTRRSSGRRPSPRCRRRFDEQHRQPVFKQVPSRHGLVGALAGVAPYRAGGRRDASDVEVLAVHADRGSGPTGRCFR